MPKSLDPAIIEALNLDPSNTTVALHGGSGFSATAKITTTIDGQENHYFLKTSSDSDAATMFKGEYASLAAIHSAIPSLCPAPLAHGLLARPPSGSYLVTEFLDMSHHSSSSSASGSSLAAKLARLHTTLAPPPPGAATPLFGFPVTTCCGATEQPNTFSDSWPQFFADKRLRAIYRASAKSNGPDAELQRHVERMAETVVPRLLRRGHLRPSSASQDDNADSIGEIVPVVVHGDLWSGNYGYGRIGGRYDGRVEAIVFDPSACYAHAEYEHGIMRMFGGFGPRFWDEYFGMVGKSKPVEEYEDRVRLYELYHHLNHHALFGGGGYRSSAMAIMKKLWQRYGKATAN